MKFTEMNAQILAEKYIGRLEKTYEEKVFWKILFQCLKDDGCVEANQMSLIKQMMFEEDYAGLLDQSESLDYKNVIRNILESFKWADKILLEKDAFIYDNSQKRFLEYKKVHALNEEKYIEQFYERAKKYFILYQIYNNKFDILRIKFEEKICYRKYGRYDALSGEDHCFSPIIDLQCSNVERKGFLRKIPEDMRGITEYGYDETGKLIMYEVHESYGGSREYGFFLYANEWMLKLAFDINIGLRRICIRKYPDDLISEYECICITKVEKGIIFANDMERECYQYSKNDILEKVISEKYSFPSLLCSNNIWLSEQLDRTIYTFECDEEECLKKIIMEKYDGDRLKPEKTCYATLNERKRKSTGKGKNRWKKPNYFAK